MKCPVCGFETTLSQCAQCGHKLNVNLGKCKITWGDGSVHEGEVELIQHPTKYVFIEEKLEALSKLSAEFFNRVLYVPLRLLRPPHPPRLQTEPGHRSVLQTLTSSGTNCAALRSRDVGHDPSKESKPQQDSKPKQATAQLPNRLGNLFCAFVAHRRHSVTPTPRLHPRKPIPDKRSAWPRCAWPSIRY